MTFIETDRLILRNVAAKDADIMYDYQYKKLFESFELELVICQ